MSSQINPEKNVNSAKGVADRLCSMINSGELTAGDKLVPERELAKLLGVSRPTLRAGIRTLSTVGILNSRQGAGTYVAQAGESATPDDSPLKILSAIHGYSTDEVFETYTKFKISIAGLAAERASREHLSFLLMELNAMYSCFNDQEQFLVHEAQFDQTIAEASQNRVMAALMNMVSDLYFEICSKTPPSSSDLKESADQYKMIYNAILEGDQESASKAMQNHLVRSKRT